jgi:hypothetical protein
MITTGGKEGGRNGMVKRKSEDKEGRYLVPRLKDGGERGRDGGKSGDKKIKEENGGSSEDRERGEVGLG